MGKEERILSRRNFLVVIPGPEPLISINNRVIRELRKIPQVVKFSSDISFDYNYYFILYYLFSTPKFDYVTIDKCLHNDILYTQQFLKEHKDLLVTRADKEDATVIINKSEYNKKVEQIIRNTS